MKPSANLKFKWGYLLLPFIIVVLSITAIDFIHISKYQIYPVRPAASINCQQDQVYFDLVSGSEEIDWSRLNGSLEYIQNEYDCSDFRLVNTIRILYEFGNQIPENTITKIEDTLFGFRYWWDEPEGNSMCYWSENHQILFASAEYLIGQKYPDQVFANSGLTGKEHKEKARKRILDWMEMRWNYGFTEFFSGVYYKEDIGAMINLIDFSDDEEIAQKMKIIMDLLFYDVATQSIQTMFVSASGRAYTGNRKGGPGLNLGGLTNYYWGDGNMINPGLMYGMMTTKKYTLPPVLIDIARDTSVVIIKQNNGLDVSELKMEGFKGIDDRSMMMQLGMEAFTNPEVVHNTMSFTRKNRMFTNDFLKDLKRIDFTLLNWFHLEPLISRIIKPQTDGVAIQKGNTYTYKTTAYTLYAAQNYHPGSFGDQQHVTGMNIGGAFSVFHTHPALEEGVPKQSPNYWVGYGHLPHVAQDERVSLAIYDIPEKKGMMEDALLNYTHAYFPTTQFDSVWVVDNYAFGKKRNTYCAFVVTNPLRFRENTDDDLIQDGKQVFWIVEAGSKNEDGSFDAFCERIQNNPIDFDVDKLKLNYQSGGNQYNLVFDGDFIVNGKPVETEYDRYDSPYIQAKKKADEFTFKFNGKSLHLDYQNGIREY